MFFVDNFPAIQFVYNMQNQKRQVKILISSDCRGRLQQLNGKITALLQKNSFDFVLLTGEVCHPRSAGFIQSLRQGQSTLPLPLYFIDSSEMAPIFHKLHPSGFQVSKNFHFLGSYGVTKIQNTTIAYFSFSDEWENKPPKRQEIQQFLQQCKGKKIDILMTNQWSKQAKSIANKENAKWAEYVTKIAAQINPHYHIVSGGDGFYRLSPYCNGDGNQTHFICVAPYEETPKDKYIFGLTVKPGVEEQANSNVLQNIYQKSSQIEQNQDASSLQNAIKKNYTKRETQKIDDSEAVIYFEGFPDWARSSDITEFLQRWGDIKTLQVSRQLSKGTRCGIVKYQQTVSTKNCAEASEKHLFHNKRIKFTKRALKESKRHEDCWFCKSKGDTSLILYEGSNCYISLEKGPLCKFHMQIIPYNHVQTTGRLSLQQQQEIQNIIKMMSSHFTSKGLEIIIYERYIPLSQAINHCVIHILPLKKGQQTFRKMFEKLNSSDNLGFSLEKGDRRKLQHFVKIKFDDQTFIKEVSKKDRVQADYMRVVLSQLLNNPRLVNWKQCIREQQQLQTEVRQIKQQIKNSGLIIKN